MNTEKCHHILAIICDLATKIHIYDKYISNHPRCLLKKRLKIIFEKKMSGDIGDNFLLPVILR